MNFTEISRELISGKKVRRSCWEAGHYWEIKNSQIKNSAGETPTINAHQLQAVDWELYEEGFCLSDKKEMWAGDFYYEAEDVEEFIRRLKEEINIKLGEDKNNSDYEETWGDSTSDFFELIDKLAGDELKS